MFEQCKTVMESIGVEKVIQFVSDSGPDAAKCRRLLMNEYTHILGVPCVAHSLDLLIEDFFKLPYFDSKYFPTFFRISAQLFSLSQNLYSL